MALIFGIESTCDETAAAVVQDGWLVRSNVIASQADLHARYRGVVPEIACRAHIENLLPVLREAMAIAHVGWDDIDAIAVAHRPGLIGSLLIGVTAAKTLAWSLGKPLIGVDHVQAHLHSVILRDNDAPSDPPPPTPDPQRPTGPRSTGVPRDLQPTTANPQPATLARETGAPPDPPPFPAVGLVASGGHTALYALNSFDDARIIGSTLDDAVGEAYDKVAAILGQGYPGGPILDRLAAEGDPRAIAFPRSYLQRDSLDFSFSGLKTAVLYHVRGVPSRKSPLPKRDPGRDEPTPPPDAELRNIAAAFQAACIDVILEKLRRAIRRVGARSVLVGGGVSANRGLRNALANLKLPVFLPEPAFCTDNAAMSAGLADAAFARGDFSPLDLDALTDSRLRR